MKNKNLTGLLLRVGMNKNIVLAILFLILNHFVQAQTQKDTISQRIILIGDAGQLTDGHHPVVDAVRSHITLDNKTTILYLGDNLYPKGLPGDEFFTYIKQRSVLDSQLSIADGTPAKILMIPGNHDWENGGKDGLATVMREQEYVDFFPKNNKNIKFWPEDGCPGPKEISLGNDVTLILFDSQWWLHPNDKPGLESDCDCKTKEELVSRIADIAGRNAKKLVILACHHPFKSNGPHGGFFDLKQHVFPFTDIFRALIYRCRLLALFIPLPGVYLAHHRI
jgi:hypothetical protein